MKLVPFIVNIPARLPEASRKDRAQVQRELTAEMPAILAWAIQGAVHWYKSGLKEPPEVTKATEEYRQEMDTLSNFIDECCVGEVHKQIRKKRLFEAYQRWCDENNEYALSARTFGIQLGEKGYRKKPDGAGYLLSRDRSSRQDSTTGQSKRFGRPPPLT